jgi:hypothetical protein
LLGVALIGPKYNQRQGAVERRYEARREIAHRQLEQSANEPAPDETLPDEPAPDDSAPLDASAHIVPLLPLALVLIVGNLVAIVLFTFNQIRLLRPEAENSHPPSP